MRVFPTRLFNFEGIEADIERRTLSGGTAISGEEAVVEVDGGGRVYAVFSNPYLDDTDTARSWRALSTSLGNGGAIVVPLGDARHQEFGDVTTPPGGLPWWDEADFVYDEPDAVAAAAPLGATSLTLSDLTVTGPVRWGIRLSIKHPTWGHRAYFIHAVSDDGLTVSFLPPLREAVVDGTSVELRDPKCTMKVEGSMTSPMVGGYAAADQVRFVEYPGSVE